MDSIISRILDIDGQAREITQEALDLKEKTIRNLDYEKDLLRSQLMARAQKRVEAIEEVEKTSALKKIDAIWKEYDSQQNKMIRIYESQHTDWENKIFKHILGR